MSKMIILRASVFMMAGLVAYAACANDFETARTQSANVDRVNSRVMVRAIERPTLAALDFAAWDRNPIFHYPLTTALKPPAQVATLANLHFGAALDPATICDRLTDTPLSEAERALPLAWQPLTNYLLSRDYDRAAPLVITGARVSAERWGNDELVRPLQQIALAFVHGDQLWVKIEFRPEVTWVPASDEDGDSYREMYARLAIEPLAPEMRAAIIDDYAGRNLNADEVDAYFYSLCSEWYQSLRTYLLEGDQALPWPNAETDAAAATEMGNRVLAAPTAVIRGVPYGQPIYNIFVVATTASATATDGPVTAAPTVQGSDAGAAATEFSPLKAAQWNEELKRWGGSWDAWTKSLLDFQTDVSSLLQATPKEQSGIVGGDGWLFFRGDLEYLLCDNLRHQRAGKNPWPAIIDFRNQLAAHNVDLLVVIIPTKAEVYPEMLSQNSPGTNGPWVAPQCRKFLSELDAAGVQVVDLLPTFMAQRDVTSEPLYMPQDTHWTNRGLRLAAQIIARRVHEYPWFSETDAQPDRFGVRAATCSRLGDIVGMLPETDRASYRPMQLQAEQVVTADGVFYKDDQSSPIVMLGDSFTGVFHFEDCQHAGLSAHLAKDLGLPIDLIMAQGSGPRIRGQLARRGPDGLTGKRLVIWTMVSRDLYNYWANWDLIRLP